MSSRAKPRDLSRLFFLFPPFLFSSVSALTGASAPVIPSEAEGPLPPFLSFPAFSLLLRFSTYRGLSTCHPERSRGTSPAFSFFSPAFSFRLRLGAASLRFFFRFG